ncbi:hypothetical protein KSP40_PGU008902 [Platanthera guangdongensis]|uniref:Uncharacterized protein n=1 Tax=Platanthera guangdongensis TaxID=2320717 RepID=A0ABR2MZZ3_9ASPA
MSIPSFIGQEITILVKHKQRLSSIRKGLTGGGPKVERTKQNQPKWGQSGLSNHKNKTRWPQAETTPPLAKFSHKRSCHGSQIRLHDELHHIKRITRFRQNSLSIPSPNLIWINPPKIPAGYMIDNPSKGESVDYNARVPFALGWASFEMNSFSTRPLALYTITTKKIVKRSTRKDLVRPTGESSHSQKPAEKTVCRADISAREDAAVDAEPLRSEKMVTLSDSAPSQKTATSADTVGEHIEADISSLNAQQSEAEATGNKELEVNWEQGYMIDNPSKGESVDYNARVPFALGWASFEMNSFSTRPLALYTITTKKIVKRSTRKDLVRPTGESSHSQKPAEKTVRRADISAREDAAVDAEPLRSEKKVTLSDSAPSQKTATSADTVGEHIEADISSPNAQVSIVNLDEEDRRTEEEDDAPSKALTAVNPEPIRENQPDLGVSAADSAEKIAKIKKRKRDGATVAERVEKKLRAMKVKNVSKRTGDADLQHIPRDKEVPDSDLFTPEAQIQGDNSFSTVSLTTDEILDSIDVNKVDLINESLLIVLQQSEAEATGNKGSDSSGSGSGGYSLEVDIVGESPAPPEKKQKTTD